MTKIEMMKLGAEHAKAGKQMTPHDCREIDAEIIAEAKIRTSHLTDYLDRITEQSRVYKQLRGAFNKGWQKEYFVMVSQ